jgi:hypothetical protein
MISREDVIRALKEATQDVSTREVVRANRGA